MKIRVAFVAPALVAILLPGFGFAQSGLIEEVIVTAQKREQNTQDVSIAVTAFTGEQLSNLGMENQAQVIAQTPGVSLLDFGPSMSIRIRGIGTGAFSEIVEAPAAIYRDEVYRPNMPANSAQMFDVERVEILRGPQGTLFGRNTNAGLIHVLSRRPTETFEGYAEVQAGNFGQFIFEGALGGPLSQTVRGRLSAKLNTDDGYVKNLGSGGGDEFGATDILALRGQFEFDLGESASLLLVASHSNEDSTNRLYNARGTIDPATFAACPAQAVLAQECVTLDTGFRFDDDYRVGYSEQSDLPQEMEVTDVSARLTLDINDSVSVTAITSFEDYERFMAEEVDSSDVGFFGFQVDNTYTTEAGTFAQEIRLNGESDRSRWVIGGYYFHDDKDRVDSTLSSLGLDTLADVTTESVALFGQVDFAVSETVTLVGGLRYSEDDRKANVHALFAVPPADMATFDVKADAVTYKVGFEWRPSDAALVYGHASSGFKSPEFNLTLQGLDANGAAPISEEEITSFEFGAKWTSSGGRARLNGAVFYSDLEGFQASTYSGFANIYLNIGDAEVYGAELELHASPTDNLELLLGIVYLDTEVSSGLTTQAGALDETLFFGTTWPLDGTEMLASPQIALNGIVRYNFFTATGGTFALQVEFNWQDDVFWDISDNPYDIQESYGLANLRGFWEHPNGNLYAQVFMNNVANKYYDTSAITVGGFDRQIVIPGKPRTYGISLGMRF